MTQAAVGWADLLQVLDALPEGRWNVAADALGFLPREGRHPQLPLPIPPVERPPEPAPPPAQPEPAQVQAAAEERQVFWRVASDLPDPEAITEAPAWFTRTDLPDASVFQSAPDVAAPARRPLARPAQLAAFFRRHLAFERPSAEPDLRRLLRHIVRQQPLRRWPLRLRRRWPARVHLVYDRSPALQPLHDDLAPIARQLHRLLGPRLNLLLADGSPSGLRDEDERPARLESDGASVVLLGDAGQLSVAGESAQAWSRWSAQRESTGRRPLVVAPLPMVRVESQLIRHADVCPLDAAGAPRLATTRAARPAPAVPDIAPLRAALFGNSFITPDLLRDLRITLQRTGHPLDAAAEAAVWHDPAVGASAVACTLRAEQRDAVADDFRSLDPTLRLQIAAVHWHHLQSASPLVRAEYLGWVRPQLPEGTALAAEFDAALQQAQEMMQQACVVMRHDPTGLGRDLAAYVGRLGHRSPRLVEMGDDALQAAWMLAQHEALQQGQIRPPPGLRQDKLAWLWNELPELGTPLVLCIEGALIGDPPGRPGQQLVLRVADRAGGQAVLLSVGRVARVELKPSNSTLSKAIQSQVDAVMAEIGEWSPSIQKTVMAALSSWEVIDSEEPISELRTILANAVVNSGAPNKSEHILLLALSKWVIPHSSKFDKQRPLRSMRDALLKHVQAPALEAFFAALDGWQEQAKPTELCSDEPLPLQRGQSYEITSGARSWLIEPFFQPEWATAMTFDRNRWQARAPDGRWLTWVPKRQIRLGSDLLGKPYELPWGAWWKTAYDELLTNDRGLLVCPEWASRDGLDEFGWWAEFTVRGRSGPVTQRLRWIPPGEFWMGSPKAEAQRTADGEYAETLHRVVLTRGYWLADTACTQALWEAVLGENPSHFKGDPTHPVETVSWKEVKEKFLPALNRLVPGLEAELPSEAQWEYACRAGTQTPFWFGEQITPEQVNYNGNYPYAKGKKGEYRNKTVPVKSLPANGWGLYEMHGNVWEWCEDVRGEYPKEAVVDPIGPRDGVEGRQRVLRGGGWFGSGGSCRSADRLAVEPDERSLSFGFRLARGLGVSPPAGQGAGGARGQRAEPVAPERSAERAAGIEAAGAAAPAAREKTKAKAAPAAAGKKRM